MEALPSALQVKLHPRVERLGYLGEFFQVAGHQPPAMSAFIDLGEAVAAALPFDLVEVVALTVATLRDNSYELHQHEHLAVARGLDPGWVRDVEACSASDGALASTQAAVQSYVVAAVRGHRDTGQRLEEVVRAVGETTAVGIVLATARYIAHALVVHSFELAAPVPSIFPTTDRIGSPAS
jgi:alkylhydroperoxidase family enzyme